MGRSQKELGIIIPFFKIDFFKETLDSLVQQTNKNFNVYIGDDASNEEPQELISNYRNLVNITYVRFADNLGMESLTRQWDRCIELSGREKWLMILGDDDYLSINLVQEFYANLPEINKREINVVHFASKEVGVNGHISELYTHPKIENATDFFFRKFLGRSRGSLTEQIFRKDAYLRHGFRNFPLGWGADNFAWLEFSDFGQIYSINSATAFFRISEKNISRSGYAEEIKLNVRFSYLKEIIEEHLKKFDGAQRVPLLIYFEKIAMKAGQFSPILWYRMSFLFINEKEFIELMKFNKRALSFWWVQCKKKVLVCRHL